MEGLISKMRTISQAPSLAQKPAQRTPLGRRLLGTLTRGPNRKFPGLHPPPGGTTSSPLPINGRFAFPILAFLAVLAVGLLFLLPGGLLQAQVSGSGAGCEENADETGYDCEYAENGKDPVATFTATDPEGAAVSWDLDTTGGDDYELFAISKDGVLTFKSPPNYEESGTDNMHEVTVRATDNMYDIDGVMGGATTKLVMVEVTNEEEPGSVKLTVNGTNGQPVLQPQMGEALTATLSDGDTPVDAAGIEWQWYRGSTEIIGATNGAGTVMSEYTPVQADIGEKLTVKATYTDGKNSNDKDMAEATTIMAVRAAPSTNSDPAFPDEDLITPDVQKTPKRKVAENTPAGRNIGAPVKANDEGDVLAYSVSGTLFDIDIATGQLKTKGKLNREAQDGDEHMVTVTAVDPFGQTDTATVTIEVENVDERPAINERTAKAKLMYLEPVGETVTETTPDPVLLWTYTAMDDEDAVGTPVDLKWKLEGRDRTKLTIGSADDDRGQLMFMKNPDFEKPVDANKDNVYEVTVVVTDSGDLTDTLAVRVEVTNAEEAGMVTFTVATPRVGVPLTAMLDDPDGDETGHEWQWMVADTATDTDTGTAIDGATSATFTPRDRDVGKFLGVKVKYTDGKGKDSAEEKLGPENAAVAVAPVAAPRFYDKADGATDRKVVDKFELKLEENTEPTFDPNQHKKDGDIFVGHREDDPETGLTYTVGGTDAASFKVMPDAANNMVKLQAQGPLDYETKKSYSVEVTATDSDGNKATLAVTVTVTDANEMPAVSGSGAGCEENADETGYDCEYAENGKDPVATFTATDPEGAAVSWDLDTTGGDDYELFAISKDGVLTFKSPPNYEESGTDNMHEVTVRATDNMYDIDGVMGGATTKLVMVEVTNEEEPGSVKLTVNGTNGQPVLQPQMGVALTATLSDGDTPVDAGIEWQWYRGSTEIIGATNGAGTVMSEYTPDESDISSRLTAKATYIDGEDSNNKKMAEATTRSVRRAPSTNNGPAFPDEDLSTPDVQKTPKRKVAENTPAGRNIGAPVKANDEGDVLAYSVSGTLFDIDIATGQLKTKGKLNREAQDGDEHMVTVTAVDPFGQTDTATVTIEVENVDERPAINERTAKAKLMYLEPVGETVTETTPDPVLLWTYTAMDDEDAVGTPVDLKWKLEGRDRTKLTIGSADDDRGQLMFMKNPDFEKPVDANKDNVYEVTVVVTDSGDLTDTLAVRVEVTNAEEAGMVTFTVATPRVGVPLTAMLDDPDGDETGHEWQWMVADTATDTDTGTAIDGATSATFTPRDRDVGKFLGVKVKYTDGKGKDSAEEKLGPENAAVAVAPVAAPRFYDKADGATDRKVVDKFELKLEENTEPTFDPNQHKKDGDIFVGHREDDPETGLTYTVGGTDAASFKVMPDAANNMVKLQAQGPLDYETKKSYSVEVTATDSDGNKATLAVTVTVTDANEMPDVVVGGLAISGVSSVSYAENRMDAVAEYTLAGPMKDRASWALEGDDASDFMLMNGTLKFKRSPNYEMPMDMGENNTYEVTIKANDGTYMDTHAVMVMVTNVDEIGTLSGSETVSNYMEDSEDAVGTYTVSGGSMSEMANLTLMGDDAGDFRIMDDGMLKFSSPPDYEAPADMGMDNTYMVTVKAEAGGEMDMITVTITVTNEDELGRVTFWRDGADATTATIVVGDELDGAVDDPDGNPGDTFPIAMYTRIANVTSWQWAKSTTPDMMDSWMDITGATDAAYMVMEGDNGYYLRATAMYDDGEGMGKMASEETMMVTMSASPMFEFETDTREVPENTEAGMDIGDPVTATDADGDTLNYTLGGTDAASFAIDSGTGQLMTMAELDHETKGSYTVTVEVSDNEDDTGAADTMVDDTVEVTITVTNVDEPGTVTLDSDRPVVGTALTATLTDLDGGVTGTTWEWASSAAADGTFAPIEGATDPSYMPVEADEGNYLRATASYTDGEGSGKTAMDMTAYAVSSNSAPVFNDDQGMAIADGMGVTRMVAENSAAGTNVGEPVAATDVDTGDTLDYTLSGADMASFAIDNMGQITVGAGTVLDYEATKNTYMVTVTASDGTASDTIDVTITVDDMSLGAVADVYDIDKDEVITKDEALGAVGDYFDGDITKDEVLAVIGAYFR